MIFFVFVNRSKIFVFLVCKTSINNRDNILEAVHPIHLLDHESRNYSLKVDVSQNIVMLHSMLFSNEVSF